MVVIINYTYVYKNGDQVYGVEPVANLKKVFWQYLKLLKT